MKLTGSFQSTKASVLSLLVVVTFLLYFSYDVGYRYPAQHANQESEFAKKLNEVTSKSRLNNLVTPKPGVSGSVAGISQESQELEGVNQDPQDLRVNWQPNPAWQKATVQRVVDGDTLVVLISGKSEKVRLVGIDAPEMGSSYTGECMSVESKSFLQSLVEGNSIWLQPDATQADRDRYGRLLRFVFLDDGTDVGQALLKEGLATEYLYSKKPHQYRELYWASQKTAQEKQINLWDVSLCSLP